MAHAFAQILGAIEARVSNWCAEPIDHLIENGLLVLSEMNSKKFGT